MLSSALSALDDRADNFQRDDRPARGAGGRGRRRGGSKGSTGPGGGAGGGDDQRDILLSKKLSYVLRHGAKKEGLSIDEGGWVRVEDLVSALLCYVLPRSSPCTYHHRSWPRSGFGD